MIEKLKNMLQGNPELKKKFASEIGKFMSDEQKRNVISELYNRHKDREDIEEMLKQMKQMLGYIGEDVPRRI